MHLPCAIVGIGQTQHKSRRWDVSLGGLVREAARRALAVGYQKRSEGNAQFALGSGRGASLGAGGAFAPYMRGYIHRSGSPLDVGPMVAVKDRKNALKNPYAHLRIEDISLEKVKSSPMMWDPVRYLESCPSS